MSVRYVSDEDGSRIAVLLDIKEYERMVRSVKTSLTLAQPTRCELPSRVAMTSSSSMSRPGKR